MRAFLKLILVLVIVGGIAAAGYAWYVRNMGKATVAYRTAPVTRGDLLATISATGTAEPEELVDVGAQVAGQINSFGKDRQDKTIDYGSVVEADMVLAQIDDSLYQADVAQAEAQLAQAKATVERAVADLGQMKAKLEQARRDWERAQKLGPSDALAESSYDAYRAAFDTAKANLAVGEAAVVQGKASVVQAEAVLKRAKRNLGYCTIKSPVNGVIIDRRVNIGQTVVASLNAPSLFLIAKDLKRMQVWVSVNEADIGQIQPGMPVSFTVDAFPGQTFRGEVGKVRLNATMTQNVVNYTVEVVTDNSSGKLLPYLTCNVQFEVKHHKDVLLVPNAALRYRPQAEQVAPEFRETLGGKGGRPATRSASRPTTRRSESDAGGPTRGIVYVQEGQWLKPIRVKIGPTDGTNTEVQANGIDDGMELVIGDNGQGAAQGMGGGSSPFTPQFRRR